ncbi:MAG: L-2-amino-thiazoline-4-carboxylic acid hydrolase [Eubacterium sp.]|nr:L-2-amino-thiazoline-4-carboxylic acid hydrolase [Eubacterium sp.]
MKKYIPAKMIRQSRFITFFETWNENDKAQLITQMDRLIKENQEYADSNNYGHLCNLITSIAMIMVLEQNGKTRGEAEKEVSEAMYEYIKPQIVSMKRLASHGWFVRFLKITMPLKFKKTLGYGWDVEFPKCPSDTFTMITHKCIYQQLFAKYGMPEMTARFCKVDDILYSDLPRAEFIYTQQIGKGGDMCDYSYKKR